MNSNADSIEILPARMAPQPLERADEPVRLLMLTRAVLDECLAPPRALRQRLGPRARDRAEYWETLCYATLWLCAWTGIGLCFL